MDCGVEIKNMSDGIEVKSEDQDPFDEDWYSKGVTVKEDCNDCVKNEKANVKIENANVKIENANVEIENANVKSENANVKIEVEYNNIFIDCNSIKNEEYLHIASPSIPQNEEIESLLKKEEIVNMKSENVNIKIENPNLEYSDLFIDSNSSSISQNEEIESFLKKEEIVNCKSDNVIVKIENEDLEYSDLFIDSDSDTKEDYLHRPMNNSSISKNEEIENLREKEKISEDMNVMICEEDEDMLRLEEVNTSGKNTTWQMNTEENDITEHANKNGDSKKRISPGNINNESVKQSNTPRKRIENYYKKPYVCDICSKCFNQKTSLSYHKQLHSEKKNYTCKMCDKTLLLDMSQPKNLIHTCVFTCNICDKSFATKILLTKHLQQIHCRVFVCKICKKSFITYDEFRRHKPTCLPKITCTICSKVFSQNKFAAHVAKHSGKKCTICNKLLYSNYGYRQHLQAHEKKKKMTD